jgi:heat shock protein HslJ
VVPTTPAGAGSSSLAGTQWRLVSFGAPGAETPVVEGSTVTLEFMTDSQAGGAGGCNSYGGEYQVQDNSVSFANIISTQMACADAGMMQQEQQFFQALQSAGQFELMGDQLVIWYDGGQGVLNFVRASVPAPIPPTPVPTAVPPATPVPPAPQPPDEGSSPENPTRIIFEPGATSAEIEAVVEERGADYYVLRAQQGQVMSVEITSPNNDVLLTVVGEDGTPLKRYQVGPPAWTSELPATQDYFIHAVSVGASSPYTLRVSVEPLGSETAERIEFEPGATSATRSGVLPSGGTKQYVLAAAAGQVMEVRTTGYNEPVSFVVSSPGGETWAGEPAGSEVYIYTTLIALPEAGDYLVTLWVPAGAGATQYDVTFTIDASTPPSPSEPPERVEFGPGAISAQRSSLMPTGPGVQQYVLTANAGQTMTVELTSDGVPLALAIESPAGVQWIPEAAPADQGYRSVQTLTLPETGDYLVTLTKADHTPSTNYKVVFTIQ